jgi:hypothetical protein
MQPAEAAEKQPTKAIKKRGAGADSHFARAEKEIALGLQKSRLADAERKREDDEFVILVRLALAQGSKAPSKTIPRTLRRT